jgi:hypothetical protein
LDDALLARLLTPGCLQGHLSQRLDLAGARLLSARSRSIDAPGYLSDLIGVDFEWDTTSGAPARAVLKVSHPGYGREELPFYDKVAERLLCPVIPRFFAGGLDAPTNRTWILIEDLSDSHQRPSEAPLPPTLARCGHLVEALAQFHAAGWEMDGLQQVGPTLHARLLASDWLGPAIDRLFGNAGDALAEPTRALYARWLRAFPALVERAGALRGSTVVHGDAHVWNMMLPKECTDDLPRLIDWDGWHVGAAVWDLAYMMAVQWDRGVRQRFELRLLDQYHRALTLSGVTGYSREALQEDYRFAVLLHLRTPIARFARGMSAYVWWPQLTRIQQAVEDHRCADMLD